MMNAWNENVDNRELIFNLERKMFELSRMVVDGNDRSLPVGYQHVPLLNPMYNPTVNPRVHEVPIKMYKKYPLRSDKKFSVVPYTQPQNQGPQQTDEINLQKLNIETIRYKTDVEKVDDAIANCNSYLNYLIEEQQDLVVMKSNSLERSGAESTLTTLIQRLDEEIFNLPEVLQAINVKDDKSITAILGDFSETFYSMKEVGKLKFFSGSRNNHLDDDDMTMALQSIADMTEMVRNVCVYVHCAKKGITGVKKCSSPPAHERNIFIGE